MVALGISVKKVLLCWNDHHHLPLILSTFSHYIQFFASERICFLLCIFNLIIEFLQLKQTECETFREGVKIKKCFLLQFNIDRNFDAFHRLRQSTFFKDIGRQISIEFRNVLSLVSHIVFAKKPGMYCMQVLCEQ